MTDYAISKKSKRSLWIPILVFITLAACASAGYSYWHSHQVAADDKAQQRSALTGLLCAGYLYGSIWAMRIACFISGEGLTLRLKDEATRSRLVDYCRKSVVACCYCFRVRMLPYWRQKKARKNLIAEIKTTLSTPLVAGQPETGCHRRAVYRFYSAITTWAIVCSS